MTTLGRRPAVLAALAACVCLLSTAAPPALGARSLETSMMDDQLLLGADQPAVDSAMARFVALGVDRLRVSAFWSDHAPSPDARRKPAGFDAANPFSPGYRWDDLDRVVRSAREHGLRVMVSISTPAPLWATADPASGNHVLRPRADELALYAHAVALRYGSVVDHYGLLNEPNQGAWLQPQSSRSRLIAPHLYRALAVASYPAIKSADPTSTVLLGELAGTGRDGRGATRPIRPLTFLREMGCVSARFNRVRGGSCRGFTPAPADALGHHPYSLFSPPTAHSRARDDATIGDGRRLVSTLDRLVARGRIASRRGRRLDVYYTEFGYQTDPPDPFAGVPLATQDRYLQSAAYVAWRTPRVRGLNQFRLTDGGLHRAEGTEGFREFQSGLMFAGGKPKPSYASFPNPFVVSDTTPRRGRSIRLWGQVRPGASHRVAVQRRTGHRPYATLAQRTTDAHGVFTYVTRARSAEYRYVWEGRTSRAIRVRPR